MRYSTVLPRQLSVSDAFSVEPTPLNSLYRFFESVPDWRSDQGKRYPLAAILTLSFCALATGANSYQAISEYARNYEEDIKTLVPLLVGVTPVISTLHRVFSGIAIEEVEQVVKKWVLCMIILHTGDALALDGKTVHGSGRHLLCAFAHEACATVFQKGTDTKGKELVVGPQVLREVPLKDHVVTGDAMFAQRDICDDLVVAGAGYVFMVKGNQETLELSLHDYFNSSSDGSEIVTYTESEKSSGTFFHRTLRMTDDPDLIKYLNWPGITHVFWIQRDTEKKGVTTRQIAVGIARLLTDHDSVQDLFRYIRGHWHIENNLHRTKDMFFKEDSCPVRDGNASQLLSSLRNMATSIFHLKDVRAFPSAMRRFAACPHELFYLLGLTPLRPASFGLNTE